MGVAKEVAKDVLAAQHLGGVLPRKVLWAVLAIVVLGILIHRLTSG
jgi:hypothetical protein